MYRYLIAAITLGLMTGPAWAEEESAVTHCPSTQASTVFVPDKTGNRQKGSAERLREAHTNAQDKGWEFKDLEVYIEDGDLQGFFVTYTRPHPCNENH